MRSSESYKLGQTSVRSRQEERNAAVTFSVARMVNILLPSTVPCSRRSAFMKIIVRRVRRKLSLFPWSQPPVHHLFFLGELSEKPRDTDWMNYIESSQPVLNRKSPGPHLSLPRQIPETPRSNLISPELDISDLDLAICYQQNRDNALYSLKNGWYRVIQCLNPDCRFTF